METRRVRDIAEALAAPRFNFVIYKRYFHHIYPTTVKER